MSKWAYHTLTFTLTAAQNIKIKHHSLSRHHGQNGLFGRIKTKNDTPRQIRDQEAAGSSPVTPTNRKT